MDTHDSSISLTESRLPHVLKGPVVQKTRERIDNNLEEVLQELYQQKQNARIVAEHLGVSHGTVAQWLIRLGVLGHGRPLGFQTGSKNPAWRGGGGQTYGPGWKKARRLALERAHGRCEKCKRSASVNGYAPDVHHTIPVRYFKTVVEAHALTNLKVLCRRCHKKEEKRSRAALPLFNAAKPPRPTVPPAKQRQPISCAVCHISFMPKKKRQRYCSNTCKRVIHKPPPSKPAPIKTCPICQQSFKSDKTRRRYCSQICANRAKTTQKECICALCGAHFLAIPSRIKLGTDMYCSRSCRTIRLVKLRIIGRKDRLCDLHPSCPRCHKTFQPKRSKQIYCSHACVISMKRQNRICAYCDNSFTATLSLVKLGKAIFCSQRCHAQSRRTT